MLQSNMRTALPERVHCDVFRNDGSPVIGGSATGAGSRTDRNTPEQADILLRQTRACTEYESGLVLRNQHHRAEHGFRHHFNCMAQEPQHIIEIRPLRNQLQRPLLRIVERLDPFALGDVRMGTRHANRLPIVATNQTSTSIDPAVVSVLLAHSKFDIVSFSRPVKIPAELSQNGISIVRMQP